MTLNVFSLFSGAGGLDLGFKQAGFSIRFAVDNDLDCSFTRSSNGSVTNGVDVAGDATKLIFRRFNGKMCSGFGDDDSWMEHPKPDVIIGGPPCQAFSVAGNQNPEDPRATLVGHFVRLIREATPKAFVMENVAELLTSKKLHVEAARLSVLALYDAGYLVTTHVLNARDFGLPQSRERVFFVGMLRPLPHLPASSTDAYFAPKKTAGEVLREIGEDGRGHVPSAKVMPAKKPILRKSPYAGLLFNGKGRVVDLNGWSGTLPASMGGNRSPIIDDDALYDGREPWILSYHSHLMGGGDPLTEPIERLRRMTAVEAAAFQGFPKDYRFYGEQSSVFRQIGNAVPPPMARAVAEAIKSHFESHP